MLFATHRPLVVPAGDIRDELRVRLLASYTQVLLLKRGPNSIASRAVIVYIRYRGAVAMRGSDLSAEQLQRFAGSLRPKLVYIRKVKARMLQANFPSNDRMFRDLGIAEMALNDLLMEVETLLSYKSPGSSSGG